MNDTQKALISVIVPVYNVSEYMDQCLKSIINQTYDNIEIILIDDGSLDDSGLKCNEWEERDKRIIVIHKENGGLSSARNAGLDVAKGDYIMFVDSDDIVAPDLIYILHDCIKRSNADISICEVEHIFDNSHFSFSKVRDMEEFSPEEAILEMWYQKSFLPSAWGKLYKKHLFVYRRFTLNRLFEDIDIMHEIFEDTNKIVYNKSKLYGYLHRNESITTQKFSKKDMDILVIAEKMLQYVENKSLDIKKAAEAYTTVAALRVYLNAPADEKFILGIESAKEYLNKYGKSVIKDPNIRKKHRYALYLYMYCRPIMRLIYKKINRWK